MTPTTEHLKDLLAKVTPWEWELCAHLYHENENGCTCGYRGVVFGRGDYAICQPGHDITPGEEGLEPPRLPRHEEIANMRLVALAPTLAAEVVRLRAIIEKVDQYAPVADDTCDEPGITFTEAIMREWPELRPPSP